MSSVIVVEGVVFVIQVSAVVLGRAGGGTGLPALVKDAAKLGIIPELRASRDKELSFL